MIAKRLDSIIEFLIVPSFTSIGSYVRSRLFKWKRLEDYSLQNKVVVLTGATSGIGEEAAYIYARMGATLVIVGRNIKKSQALASQITRTTENTDIHYVIGDLADLSQVRDIATELKQKFPVINVLVHNAGALFNKRRRTDQGSDLSVELMVASPYLLTGLLLKPLGYKPTTENAMASSAHGPNKSPVSSPSRVITMSSGGMYTECLTVSGLEMSDEQYQGAQQYARAKRAQVVLNEIWASKIPASDIVFHSLHPGWVNTPGIVEALPRFSKVLLRLGLLRKPRDGADTMVWLSADKQAVKTNGKFWHDRSVRSINLTKKTREEDTQVTRQALWHWCEQHTKWTLKN